MLQKLSVLQLSRPSSVVLIEISSVPPPNSSLACDVHVLLVVVDCLVPLCRHAPISEEAGALQASEESRGSLVKVCGAQITLRVMATCICDVVLASMVARGSTCVRGQVSVRDEW
jgi:hypothetical protein